MAHGTTYTRLILSLVWVVGCGSSDHGSSVREPIVGGPCEGCEAVFEGLPAELTWQARIEPLGEPGEPLRIQGRVMFPDQTAAAGTIVYAYHTNADGIYPRDERFRGQAAYRHGSLRGWARADSQGRYQFETVRPAGYPGTDMPQHVHMHILEPGRCTYYIDDILFTDDPRLTDEARRQYDHGRGGSGIATPRQEPDGTWIVDRDIILGAGIPDYRQ